MRLVLVFLIVSMACCSSLVQILGMGDLLNGLAIPTPSYDQFNSPSTAYTLDPNFNLFLTQFRTRTQLCNYKCKNSFNLPCFLLFSCNVHLKNFTLIVLLPFFMLTLVGICCGKGLWTFFCWVRYLRVFLGVQFGVWVFRRCREGGAVRARKQKQKRMQEKFTLSQKIQPIDHEDQPQSANRFTTAPEPTPL